MNLEAKSLALFMRVAALGAIGRAGMEFDLSPTNASLRIQALEAELGVKLFHRTTRAVSLTHDGQVFIEHARRILDDIEETRNVFKGDAEQVQGTLKVAVSASFGRHYLVPFVPELLRLYPNLKLDIDFSDKRVDIVEQGFDVAFRMGELESSSLLARRIDDCPMVLVASLDYIARAGHPETVESLANHSCIPFERLNTWRLKDRQGNLHEVFASGPVTINWGDAISELVEAGVGIGLAALWHVGPALREGRVVQVLPEYSFYPETNIWAVRPPGRLTPVRVKVFLDFMEQRIKATNRVRYGDLL
ncbi:LysR family transcriptional regulator [Marinomonas pollencensis]|uniref:LysR family transcriptional regulator n=1 Tax=Marinomonas pollencensis TaxID=491954 RepID=A0A3E0DKQ8_9GAMM|nr:LysR family transcriptional regulator [Marinomonas pollencensis]REG83229.1 LysR family transcriptional regulator [Marinomonas pollencensis]